MAGSRWKSRYSNNNEESVAQRVIQLNLPSAFAGEANACLRDLLWAKDQGFLTITVCMDSPVLVDTLHVRVLRSCSSTTVLADKCFSCKFFNS